MPKLDSILDLAALLDVRLFPAQRCILAAATGLPLDGSQAELFAQLFGRPYDGPRAYREIWLALGRRSGKTTVLLSLLTLWTALFVPHAIPEHDRGFCLLLAPKTSRARKLFRVILSMLENHALAAFVTRVNTGANSSAIELSNGIDIGIEAANSFTLRGERLVFLGCDEGAFFKDSDSGLYNLDKILESLLPSLSDSANSVLAIASTPWGQQGPLWDAFRTRAERSDILVANAASRVINPSLPADVEEKYRKRFGEVAAQREFGAVFGRTEDSLFDPNDVQACLEGEADHFDAAACPSDFWATCALDAAQFNDEFGIAIARADSDGKRVRVMCADAVDPNQYSTSQILKAALVLCRAYEAKEIFSDRVLSRPIEDFAVQSGFDYQRVTTMGPEAREMIDNVRMLFRERLVILPGGTEKLIAQLKGMRLFLEEGGKARFEGKHDDAAMACIIAVHNASRNLTR